METYVTTVYVIADEIIRILKIQDDPQSKMSTLRFGWQSGS